MFQKYEFQIWADYKPCRPPSPPEPPRPPRLPEPEPFESMLEALKEVVFNNIKETKRALLQVLLERGSLEALLTLCLGQSFDALIKEALSHKLMGNLDAAMETLDDAASKWARACFKHNKETGCIEYDGKHWRVSSVLSSALHSERDPWPSKEVFTGLSQDAVETTPAVKLQRSIFTGLWEKLRPIKKSEEIADNALKNHIVQKIQRYITSRGSKVGVNQFRLSFWRKAPWHNCRVTEDKVREAYRLIELIDNKPFLTYEQLVRIIKVSQSINLGLRGGNAHSVFKNRGDYGVVLEDCLRMVALKAPFDVVTLALREKDCLSDLSKDGLRAIRESRLPSINSSRSGSLGDSYLPPFRDSQSPRVSQSIQ